MACEDTDRGDGEQDSGKQNADVKTLKSEFD